MCDVDITLNLDMDCIFCRIAKNELPSRTIYEDELVKVFLDIHPKHNGHTIIIPKKHFTDIEDIDPDVINYMTKIIKHVYSLLKNSLSSTGMTIMQNNGTTQDIKHYHLHLIPKYTFEKKTTIDEIYNLLKQNNN
jgi:histidine triad (HIT) family protein